MKLQYRQIEGFVKAPDKAARVILVYGPDTGLVAERCAVMGKTVVQDLNDPFNVAVLSTEMIEEDPARLSDESGAISMMGGDRLIRIERGTDKITAKVKSYLEAPSNTALVVIQAGDLGPRSSLRKLCESAKNAAAVPCYVEDERDVANVIRQTVQEEGKAIDREAVSWLAANISGDRARVRSELEKLLIYKGEENTPISMADAIACCGGASQQGLDNLTNAVAGRNAEGALKAYGVLVQEGVAFIVILRSLQNHFRRLHMAKAYMQSGMDMDSAMKKLSPPVFFKQAPQFKGQMNNWSLPLLDMIMGKLTDLEAQCKTTGVPVDTLCSQAILAISKTRAG